MRRKCIVYLAVAITTTLLTCNWRAYGQFEFSPAMSGQSNVITLSIVNEKISDAMEQLADATGLSIILSSKASGNITAYINEMEPERALREITKVNGLHYVRNEDVVWILTDDEYYQDLDEGRQRRIVPLAYADVEKAAQTVGPFLSKQGTAIAHQDNNVIVIVELSDRVNEIEKLLKDLDKPSITRVFSLEHATADEMVLLLQEHVSNPGALLADFRTNQIMVTETEEKLEKIARLLKEFDKPDKVFTRTFVLKHAEAIETAELLREILTGSRRSSSGRDGWDSTRDSGTESLQRTPTASSRAETQKSSPAPPATSTSPGNGNLRSAMSDMTASFSESDTALGPLANVAADSRTNSLIVTHTASVLERIEQVITSIDVPSNIHIYRFQNVNPAELELEKKLVGLLTPEGGHFSVDPISSKVTFRCSEEKAEEISELLKAWDDIIPQVRVEAEILSVRTSVLEELGVSWQAVINKVEQGVVTPSLDVFSNFPAAIP